MKTKTSLRLDKLNVSSKITFARDIVTAMTGNVSFPSPVPALSVITQAAADLENALNNPLMGGVAKTTLVHTKEVYLCDQLTLLAFYVDNTAQGDANLILSSGMPLRAARAASHIPDAPQNLSAVNTTVEGEIRLKWDNVANARVYVIEISDDAAAIQPTPLPSGEPVVNTTARSFITWTQVDIVAHTKYNVTGLTSGIKYAVRVYAVGAKGKSNCSVPVMVKVL
jgi:hypothetical protein